MNRDAIRLLVCGTCPRDDRRAERFAARLLGSPAGDRLRKIVPSRIVACLGGCRRPGNVALQADGERLRLSGLDADDADVGHLADLCSQASGGPTISGLLAHSPLAVKVTAVAPSPRFVPVIRNETSP